jgi:hypothetical protein
LPITAVARSKAWVIDLSNSGVMGPS